MRFYNYLLENIAKDDITDIPWLSFDSNIRSEAQYFSIDDIRIGKKFFNLPDKESQKGVLLHEIGHYIADILMKENTTWDWLDKGYFIGQFNNKEVEGINGQTAPNEVISEAFAILLLEPEFLKNHYSDLYRELSKKLKRPKFKNILERGKEIIKKL